MKKLSRGFEEYIEISRTCVHGVSLEILEDKDIMSKIYVLKEIWSFIKVRKKWWLIPIIAFLLILGILIIFAEGSALAPFIYTLF
jgi:hypothetical protein